MMVISLLAMVEYRKDKEAYEVLTSFVENIVVKDNVLIISEGKAELGYGRFYSKAVYGKVPRIKNIFYVSNKCVSNIIELERISREFTLLSDFMGDYASILGVKILSRPYENIVIGIIDPKSVKLRIEPQRLMLQAKNRIIAEAKLEIENSKIKAILYAYPETDGIVYLKLHGGVPERRISIALGSVKPGEKRIIEK